MSARAVGKRARMSRYGDEVASLATELTDAADLDPLIDRATAARVVMLGEAGHGTHESCAWRAAVRPLPVTAVSPEREAFPSGV